MIPVSKFTAKNSGKSIEFLLGVSNEAFNGCELNFSVKSASDPNNGPAVLGDLGRTLIRNLLYGDVQVQRSYPALDPLEKALHPGLKIEVATFRAYRMARSEAEKRSGMQIDYPADLQKTLLAFEFDTICGREWVGNVSIDEPFTLASEETGVAHPDVLSGCTLLDLRRVSDGAGVDPRRTFEVSFDDPAKVLDGFFNTAILIWRMPNAISSQYYSGCTGRCRNGEKIGGEGFRNLEKAYEYKAGDVFEVINPGRYHTAYHGAPRTLLPWVGSIFYSKVKLGAVLCK